jgi:type I restriction enzyme S subunit
MNNFSPVIIGNNLDFLSGFAFPSVNFNQDKRGKALIRIRDLLSNSIEAFFDGEFDDRFLIKNEDVLIGMDGDFNVVIWRKGEALLNQRVLKVSEKKDSQIDLMFFYYWLLVNLPLINDKTSGTTVKHLVVSDISDSIVNFPQKKHQKAIAAILCTIDEAIAAAEAQLAKQEKIKQGLLQDLLTRGIDETGQIRPHWEDRPDLYKSTEFGWLPQKWEIKRLETVTSHIVDCPHTTPCFVENGVLVARTFNIKDGVFICDSASFVTESEYLERISRLEPQTGDLIFTREAPVGEAFVIPNGMRICLGQRTMLIRCDKQHCLPGYLVEMFYSPKMRIRFDQIVGGTTNPHLNVSDLRQLLVILPNIYEQELISKRLASIRATLNDFRTEKYKLEKIKTGLMQDLLTGQRRVTPELIRKVETLTGSA